MKRHFYALCISAAVFLCSCKEKPQTGQPVLPTVKAETVTVGKYSPELEIIAEIKPLKTVALTPRVNGYLIQRNFSEGSYVKEGTLLYLIEQAQYRIDVRQMQANLDMAKARALNADSNYKRINELYRENVSAPQKYDMARASKLEADAAVLAAEASLQQAQLNLSYTRIKAPFNGWIGISAYDVGSYISVPSKPLNSIVYIDELRVEFELSDSYLTPGMRALLQSGKAPELEVRLLEDNSRLYPLPGRIRFWNNTISSRTNTLKIQALFANPNRTLMPGMFVRVKLKTDQMQDVVQFNKSALKQDLTSKYVFVINKSDVIEVRRIETGPEKGDTVIVRSGLKPGERLAVTGSPLVREGTKVRVLK